MFASLRANDLIWPYVVKGYLKGQAPPPFDLLYWNSDDTNLPGPMFCWYLRNTYLENKLREPGAHRCSSASRWTCGAIDVPAFVYASKEDHIVPWKTAYASTQLLSGDATFVLGASGHIAGVINPPAKKKRNYWIAAPTARWTPTRSAWFDGAEKVAGQLVAGLVRVAGAARRPAGRRAEEAGQRQFPPIEEAPGATSRRRRADRRSALLVVHSTCDRRRCSSDASVRGALTCRMRADGALTTAADARLRARGFPKRRGRGVPTSRSQSCSTARPIPRGDSTAAVWMTGRRRQERFTP